MRFAAGLLTSCLTLLCPNLVNACTCSLEHGAGSTQARGRDVSDADEQSKRYNKAALVVRGKFVSMTAPVALDGLGFKANSSTGAGRSAMGVFRVESSLKGNLAGDIEIVTGFGTGDCGLAGGILMGIAYDVRLEIEVGQQELASGKTINVASICGYIKQLERNAKNDPQSK